LEINPDFLKVLDRREGVSNEVNEKVDKIGTNGQKLFSAPLSVKYLVVNKSWLTQTFLDLGLNKDERGVFQHLHPCHACASNAGFQPYFAQDWSCRKLLMLLPYIGDSLAAGAMSKSDTPINNGSLLCQAVAMFARVENPLDRFSMLNNAYFFLSQIVSVTIDPGFILILFLMHGTVEQHD
jgi:hypothetical protein